MNEPTISARSVSLPRRSLCQWVDTVTVETLGSVSLKISLRKWKCLRRLELSPPLSRSHVGKEVKVAVGGWADLGWVGIRGGILVVRGSNVPGRPAGLSEAEEKGGGVR